MDCVKCGSVMRESAVSRDGKVIYICPVCGHIARI